MIPFKEITFADKETIQRYTLQGTLQNCDLSFTNICSWRFLYQTEYAELEGFLLFRFYTDGHLAYMMPVGEGNLYEVLLAIIEDARSLKRPFFLVGACENMKNLINSVMPGVFTFSSDRDYSDYVYLRESLATLKGKRLQSKRNHVNKFMRLYPNYEYRELTPELVPECLMLEAVWCRANNCNEHEELFNERRSLTYALQHMTELGLIGGVLHVEGRIVAFTFGAPINQNTFDVCVEKADTTIEGAYSMINYEFARHIPEQYIYVNREEDLGLEGLRKAKLSYQPEIILDKCIAKLARPLSVLAEKGASCIDDEGIKEKEKSNYVI